MEIDIHNFVEILLKLNDQNCPVENRHELEDFMHNFLQNPNSFFLLIQILSSNNFTNEVEMFAFAGLKRWKYFNYDKLNIEHKKNALISLKPLLFETKQVSKFIRDFFKDIGYNSEFIDFWKELLFDCQNLLLNLNNQILNNELMIQSVLHVVSILSEFFRKSSGRFMIDNEILSVFHSIVSPFINIQFMQNEQTCPILDFAIFSIMLLLKKNFACLELKSDNIIINFSLELIQNISEICNIYLNIFSIDIGTPFPSYLTLLINCSNDVYEILNSAFFRQEEVHRISDFVEQDQKEFLNYQNFQNYCNTLGNLTQKWKLDIFSIIWNRTLKLYSLLNNNSTLPNDYTHEKLYGQIKYCTAQIIRPLTICSFSVENLFQFIDEALLFVSLQSDDFMRELVFNPDVFYTLAYHIPRDEYGTLRSNTLITVNNVLENADPSEISKIISMFSISEPQIMIIATNIKNFRKKNLLQIVFDYIAKIFTVSVSGPPSDIISIASILFLLGNSVKAIVKFYKENSIGFIQAFVQFALKIITYHNNRITSSKIGYNKVYITLAIRLLKKIKKSGIDLPIDILPLILSVINDCISADVFSLISLIVNDHPSLYADLKSICESIFIQILNEIGDETDIFMFDQRQASLTSMLSLLNGIIQYNGDSGIEDQLYDVIFECITSNHKFDLQLQVFQLLYSVIGKNSLKSADYINQSILIMEEGKWQKIDFFGLVTSLILYMNLQSEAFIQNNFLIRLFQILIQCIQTNQITDEYDNFGLSILLCWIFQLQPQICDVPGLYLTYLRELPQNKNENCFVPYFNLIGTLICVQKLELSQEILEEWVCFLNQSTFFRVIDLEFHKMIMQRIASNYPNSTFSSLAISGYNFLNDNQIQHIAKCSAIQEFIELSNVPYPLMK